METGVPPSVCNQSEARKTRGARVVKSERSWTCLDSGVLNKVQLPLGVHSARSYVRTVYLASVFTFPVVSGIQVNLSYYSLGRSKSAKRLSLDQ
jgi:hypothetical protein